MTPTIAAPSVTVIVPAYNGERYIGAAIDSALAQSFGADRMELIVIDDGSTDATAAEVGRRPAARYMHQANAGVAAARNRGVRLAAADVVMFLDQDDVWDKDKVRLQLDFLAANAAVGVLGGHMLAFLEAPVATLTRQMSELLASRQPSYVPSVIAVRRAIFDQIGLFDVSYALGSDGEWLFRARRAGVTLAVIPELLCHYRIHERNASHDIAGMQHEMLRAVRGVRPSKLP